MAGRVIYIDTNNPRRSQSLQRTILDVHNDPLWYTMLKHRSRDFQVFIKIKSIKSFFQKRHGIVTLTEHYFLVKETN